MLSVAIRKTYSLHQVSGERLRRMQLDTIVEEGESSGLGVEFMVEKRGEEGVRERGKLEGVAGWNYTFTFV